jgi:hypothetical protein
MLLWIALGFLALWVVGFLLVHITVFLIHIALIVAVILVIAHFVTKARH